MNELLTLGDPLLPIVREHALYDAEAHNWLLDSARRWAVGKFATRELPSSDNEDRLRALVKHQVAVLIEERMAFGPEGKEKVLVGFLHESGYEYIKIEIRQGAVLAGLMGVLDAFELPPEWRTHHWPVKPTPLQRKLPDDVEREKAAEEMERERRVTTARGRRLELPGSEHSVADLLRKRREEMGGYTDTATLR